MEFYQPGGLEAQNHGGKLPVGFVTPIEDEENEDEEQDTDEIGKKCPPCYSTSYKILLFNFTELQMRKRTTRMLNMK